MEPVSLLVVAAAALGASAAKSVIGRLFNRFRSTSPTLEVVTAGGKRIAIAASELTREKVAEITNTGSVASTYY